MIVASLSHSGSKHYEKKESWKILKGYPLSIFVYIHGWLAFYEFYDHEQILMARPDSLTNYITYTGTGGVSDLFFTSFYFYFILSQLSFIFKLR